MTVHKLDLQSFTSLLLSDDRASWSRTAAQHLYYIYYGFPKGKENLAAVTADQVRSEWTEYNCQNAAISDLGNLTERVHYTLPNGHVLVHVGS